MATRAIEKGPTAERVAANVKAMRERRGMTVVELSAAMARVGRPTLATGLSKVETGDRRVDADDLVALAVALDVSPNRLLLGADGGEREVAVTPAVTVAAAEAWRWACGEAALPAGPWHDGANSQGLAHERDVQFERENQPHRPDERVILGRVSQHLQALAPVAEAVRAAHAAGVELETLHGFIDAVLLAPAPLAPLPAAK